MERPSKAIHKMRYSYSTIRSVHINKRLNWSYSGTIKVLVFKAMTSLHVQLNVTITPETAG
jgi:hypothetical protein